MPLSFAPGEAYQFDWSHEVVLINGTTVTVKVAHVRLCHSRMFFVRAYPRETQEMVFDAHDRAFAFFKGACTRGIYDNMKTAVETVFVGKERVYNRRFLQMCGHYLVEPVACTPASGWEKGQVENQVGLVRERFFTPRLRVKSYDELNAWLLDKLRRLRQGASASRVPRPDDLGGVRGRAAAAWCPMPAASMASTPCRHRCRRPAWSASTTTDTRLRQAPSAGRSRSSAYADRIVLRQDGMMVGEHRRCFGRDQTIYDPWHYVPVLARKPGRPAQRCAVQGLGAAGRHGAGQAQARRGSMMAIGRWWPSSRRCCSDGLPAVEAACAEALRDGVHSADVILNILARQREPHRASDHHDHADKHCGCA